MPPHKNIIDGYLSLIKNLSPDAKLELISKISDSMKSSAKDKNGSWKHLFGAFVSDKTAEEMIREIRSARMFSRITE